MRAPVRRRSAWHRAAAPCALAVALCVLAMLAPPSAHAAAEDINAEPAPPAVGASESVASAGRRLVDHVVEAEHAVVQTLKDHAVSPWVAPSWSLSADAPIVHGRAVDYGTRAAVAAAADTTRNSDEPGAHAADTADLSFGARLRVLRGDADLHIPMVSWMAEVQPTLANPANDRPSSATTLRPSTHLSAEWALPGDFSLGVMPGMAIDMDSLGRRTANGTLSITLGKTWSPQWRTFVDMARDRVAMLQLGGVSTTLDAGVSFAPTSATQLDFAVTHGLSPSGPPFQAGVGVSSSF